MPTLGTKFLACLLLSSVILVSGQFEHYLDSLRSSELYEFAEGSLGSIQYLPKGDSETIVLQLEQPINFYGEQYEQLYINTNGILTFNVEFPEYLNQPFPLEYPSIAAFYSNVDTSNSDEGTSISLFETREQEVLDKASSLVRYGFSSQPDFEAHQVIVATWRNVGYFDSKTDRLNTFQVALIAGEQNTFVQFIYPEGGLNWLQGESAELGLPDIRAQAGFVSEDGRYYNLNGSGSENARFLSESTNLGVPGVWLFEVAPIEPEQNVMLPDNEESRTESPALAQSCQAHAHQCHQNAQCHDKAEGYCCVCEQGFYGNGKSCLANDQPIRVSGTLSGELNHQPVNEEAKLQSYVVTSEGRTYTTINPLTAEQGAPLRLALPLLTTVPWLFAKSVGGVPNGYQLTGGVYTHVSRLQFDSGESLLVNQTFEGLNFWDQLSVKIEIYGEVPEVPAEAVLHLPEYVEQYTFERPGELKSVQVHKLEITAEQRVLGLQVEQRILYRSCLRDDEADPSATQVLQKISKVALDYVDRDQALRIGAMSKVGVTAETNSCNDGTAECVENSVCVPYEDTYRCDCLHGFAAQLDERGVEVCLDIDECAAGTHVCDENAICDNTEGGFNCYCSQGFEGNGYRCLSNSTADNIEYPPQGHDHEESTADPNSSTPGNQDQDQERDLEREREEERRREEEQRREEERRRQEEREREQYPHPDPNSEDQVPQHPDECYRCSKDADCYKGRCTCHEGFEGDGYSCSNICVHGEVWENGRCEPLLLDRHDVEPVCDALGECRCPYGYVLAEDYMRCTFNQEYDSERNSDLIPCDVDENCHINATCNWYEQELRHICTCKPGFRGDGYSCESTSDDSCDVVDICDVHASCVFVDGVKPECQCQQGYTGDGFRCQLAAECQSNEDCGKNSLCHEGVCRCQADFERDINDRCVPAGQCGTVFCGPNAFCRWDSVQSVQFCDCLEGYQGDALKGCTSKPLSCHVLNNCGIHATCEPTEDPANYECQCIAGFNGDGYVCIEEQNCLNNHTLCDLNAQCHSTNSGLVCVCNPGFYGNGFTCQERQQQDSDFLIVSQGVMIARVPLNGRNVRPISVAQMAIGLDKDCVEGRVYWGDISTKKIVSAKYDGTDSRPFITTDIESPEGIAIDVISRRLYWTDSAKDTIEVASLDDPSLRAVIINKQLVNPRGIAVDPYREKLYWSDWDRSSPKIEVSNLDGTGRELLLGQDAVTLPNSLVVLESTGEVCYADAGTKKVECIDAQSRQIRTISNELSYPFGITYTHDQFYWTDWTTKKVEIVDSLGTRQKAIQPPFFGSHKMYGMTVVEQHCPQYQSACQINNGGCTDNRICLVNRLAPSGKSCKCTSASTGCSVPAPFPGY
ncbi:nidogen [Drosophila ficusphila]|uniref:nidogen n=1 Tax=Drosophila ficusphila TaxID=30025 RepID=UPI0007E6A3A5|nr:nidogen [Drosophila ficusphila]